MHANMNANIENCRDLHNLCMFSDQLMISFVFLLPFFD